MPYYQYEVNVETNLNSQHQLTTIERDEENQFNSVLSKPKNRIIDLLDLFFPPRFRKKPDCVELYPTLPCFNHRKQALECLQTKIKSHQIEVMFDCCVDNIPDIDELANEERISSGLNPTLPRYLISCAIVKYDYADNALVGNDTLLGSPIDTVAFVELLIECKLLPFELLNFKVVLDLYLEWNKKKLDGLVEEMKDEEGWPLIAAVSYAAGFYATESCVSSEGYITGFSLEPFQPLRWMREIPENMIESSCFERKKGQIDNGKLPEKILDLQENWNNVFKNAKEAMKFGDINHTGGENVNRSDTRVREGDFFRWAQKKNLDISEQLMQNPSFNHSFEETEQFNQHFPNNKVVRITKQPGNETESDNSVKTEQKLSKPAIKKLYSKMNRDAWDYAFRNESSNKLIEAKIPAKKSRDVRYKKSKVEEWLIEMGRYKPAELERLNQSVQVPKRSSGMEDIVELASGR